MGPTAAPDLGEEIRQAQGGSSRYLKMQQDEGTQGKHRDSRLRYAQYIACLLSIVCYRLKATCGWDAEPHSKREGGREGGRAGERKGELARHRERAAAPAAMRLTLMFPSSQDHCRWDERVTHWDGPFGIG